MKPKCSIEGCGRAHHQIKSSSSKTTSALTTFAKETSDDKVTRLYHDLTQLMTLKGFQLAKWASISEDVMKEIPDYQRSTVTKIEFKDDKKFQKPLGVSWNPRLGTLNFKCDAHESVSWLRFMILWNY